MAELPGEAPITLSDIAARIEDLKDLFLSSLKVLQEGQERIAEHVDREIGELKGKLYARPCITLGENGDGACRAGGE
jgi:hypothetical protein